MELQANSAAVESTGQAKAEAQSRAEAAKIEGQAAVEQAKLKAQASKIEAVSNAVLSGDILATCTCACVSLGEGFLSVFNTDCCVYVHVQYIHVHDCLLYSYVHVFMVCLI